MRRLILSVALCGLAGAGLAVADDSGPVLYATHCAACHGADGTGEPATERVLGVGVGDLSMLTASNGGDYPAEFVARVVDGRGGPGPHAIPGKRMPAWGRLLQEGDTAEAREAIAATRIQAITDYVRTLQTEAPD